MVSFSPSSDTIPIQGYTNLTIEFTPGNTSQLGVLTVAKSTDLTKQFHIRAMVVNDEMKVYVDWATMKT